MAAVAVTGTGFPRTGWRRVAFAMLAVAWGANQFSPLLIVYRHDLGLDAGVLAGLFGIYAAALIPGLLIGGPVSDRIGRRPVVIPFVVASLLATLLFMLGPRSLAVIAAGRALAGLCSGVVFGSAAAWVQELSEDPGTSARRSAVAMSAGFGLGPAVAAVLAQWAGDPLVLPYLPHVVIGVAALAFVVLPQEVTSAGSLSVGFAGLVTAVTIGSAVAAQPLARRLEARRRLAGNVAGLACAAAGAILAIVAVATADRAVAIACAVIFGLAYGFCLVSGLRESERLADPGEHGAVVACYYVLTYVGFGAAYLVDGLNAVIGRADAFVALAAAAAVSAVWMGAYTAGSRTPERRAGADEAATDHMRSEGAARTT
ncbi:MAG TPA: MFS transporter [Streptosporangiaceae bacterium]|jgi:MFS family permease|nr:MFS transporter [Streptosporangiaceae bacterium]